MVSEYNPFAKEFRDVHVEDLDRLRTVSEGWYVEYKSRVAPPRHIAKSIGALANTHGGWLWYGVKAPSDSVGCAEGFPGIPSAEIARIRDAVASHLNPHPHFETSVFNGPCEQLQLAADHSVIAVRVSRGHYPPYVHSSGVGDVPSPVEIQRRLSDAVTHVICVLATRL